jgi:hypothetical protein
MFRVFVEPKKLLQLLYIIWVVWTITDCVRRREHNFWIVIVLLFPGIGPLLYWAWTRDWIGKLTMAGERRRATRGPSPRVVWDVAGADTPAALQKKGALLVERGEYEAAVHVLEDLLAREGPSAPNEVHYNVALAYKALGRFRDARDQLSLVVGDDPKYRTGQAFLELADCHFQMGDEARARDLFRQLLNVVRFPEARYKYGILLDRAGNRDEAVEQMRLLLNELDEAPAFHKRNNRRFRKLAKQYLKRHG